MSDDLLYMAMGNDTFRYSLLAFAASIRDMFLNQPASELHLLARSKSLRFLREAIANDQIDEFLFVSVVIHIATDTLSMNFSSSNDIYRVCASFSSSFESGERVPS